MIPNPKIEAAFLQTLNLIRILIQKATDDLSRYDFDHETLAAADKTLGEGRESLEKEVDGLYAWINAQYDACLMEKYERSQHKTFLDYLKARADRER